MVEYLQDVAELLARVIRASWRPARVRLFYLFKKHRVVNLSPSPADIAFATVGGHILMASAFKNLGNDHVFIAAAGEGHDVCRTCRVFLLEGFGHTYRKFWQSDELYGWVNMRQFFRLRDFDGDGLQEVAFASYSAGSGAGSASLFLFVPSIQKVFELTVDFDWQDHMQPPLPKLSLLPSEIDQSNRRYHAVLEKYAVESGFLRFVNVPDLDSPYYADVRWHRDNGNLTTGGLNVHYFHGPPLFQASAIDTLDDGEVVWTAHFKGPVVAHLKRENKHFVVYCPANAYHWPTCLYRSQDLLLIGTRGDGIIKYSLEKQWLQRVELEDAKNNPIEVTSIKRDDEHYVINDWYRIICSRLDTLGAYPEILRP